MAAGKRGTERITDPDDEDVETRKCLKCGKEFLSYSKYNRICNPCKRSPEYDTGVFKDWQEI